MGIVVNVEIQVVSNTPDPFDCPHRAPDRQRRPIPLHHQYAVQNAGEDRSAYEGAAAVRISSLSAAMTHAARQFRAVPLGLTTITCHPIELGAR